MLSARCSAVAHPRPLLGGEGARACSDRQTAAGRLGRERRRLFFLSTLLSLAAPVLPYMTGAWEHLWYGLAATWLPLPVRAAIFLVLFHLAYAVVLLPLAYYGGLVLPRAFGLSRQTPGGWWGDWVKGAALGVSFGALVGGLFLWSVVQLGSAWWWGLGLALSAGTVLLTFVTPYVLVPIFFRLEPLSDQRTAERVRRLAERAGATVRDVCSIDFSRRTEEANAAVIGLGRSRRVVLADTLLRHFTPDEVDAVVAHEIGHHVHRDVPRLIAANLTLVWLGLALGAWLAPTFQPVLSVPTLAYVPAYPMLFAVAQAYFLLTLPLTNWWSRRIESAADRFALRVTRDPAAFAGAMLRLSCQNLVELRPPRWAEVLLASHPPVWRRVALAEAWTQAGAQGEA